MAERPKKILLAQSDPDMVELMVASLGRRFDAHITCVSSEEDCLDVELYNPHDLVIAELDLRESAGLDMVEQLRTISDRPIIILTQEAATDCVIEAMRLGVCDVLVHPFAIAQLLDRAQHVLREHELAGKRAVKYRSMRQLVRRALRERRELNQRVELVCKDLVDSHRRLVHRVIDTDVVTSHPSE